MKHMSVPRSLRNLSLSFALAGCASAPLPQPEVARPMSPSEEAEAIEAAKRHPIATTYERKPTAQTAPAAAPQAPAQAVVNPPHQLPVAPPPVPKDQVIVVGADQPPPPPDPNARAYTWPAPTDEVYVVGDDPPPRSTGPDVDVGVYIGGGWPAYGYHYGYGYPWYPTVVVPPPYWHNHWYHDHGHHVEHHDHGHYRGGNSHWDSRSRSSSDHRWSAPAAPRREVHVAPSSGSRSGSSYGSSRARAPSSGSVRAAPAPRSSGSIPSRRAVRVR